MDRAVMADASDGAARDLADRWAIATTLARHSRGVDRNDLDLLLAAYTPDATVAYGMFEGAARDFAAYLVGAMAGTPITLHRTSNMFIRVEGDRARSESYVVAYMREAGVDGGAGTQRLIGGRYLDRHARGPDGEWRIAHRTYVMEWNANHPTSETAIAGAVMGAHRGADRASGLFAEFRAEAGEDQNVGGSVEEAVAKQALHDLVATYARGVDRGDEALLSSVFFPDAEVITGVIDGNGPDYARGIAAMVRENLKSCFHSVANEYYEVSGDRAVGESYVLAHMLTKGDAPEETLTGGRYLDRFERRDGEWKIAQRTFVYDWSTTRPSTMEEAGMYESLTTRGGWSPEDPAAAFWRG